MCDRNSPARRASRRRTGFTLVELLVVIGIIALLISILLPSLGKARKAANMVVCASNMHQISMAMIQYTNAYKGAIPGNGWTSGAFLEPPSNYNDRNCPTLCQSWDFVTPCARYMGVKNLDEGGSISSRGSRFDVLSRYPAFKCPENDIVWPAYSGSPVTINTQMLPYLSVIAFQYRSYDSSNSPPSTSTSLWQTYLPDVNYFPNINRVGDAAQKIWLTEGAKYTSSDGPAPDYDLTYDGGGSPGGAYGDWGPWSAFSRSFLKGRPMIYSMRHGDRDLASASNLSGYSRMRMNVAYFDGHVAPIDGRSAQNPIPWLPKGTTCKATETSAESKLVTGFSSDFVINN